MGNIHAVDSDKEEGESLSQSFLRHRVSSSSSLAMTDLRWQNYDEYVSMGVHVYHRGRMVRMNDSEESCIIVANCTPLNAMEFRNCAVFEWEIICHKVGNCSRIGFIRCDYNTRRHSMKRSVLHDILGNDTEKHFGIVLKENERKIVNLSTHKANMLKSKYFGTPRIKNGDRFRFRLDVRSSTVSLKWNDDDLGVIYDNIDFPIMPAVSKSGGTAQYEIQM
mmetsp:Transcript_68770/g.109194  ORF Transcript_68770/g.109194 Transcript_68770/m.109194 type:complete len:221 (+) Transcript_68770:22-684(+)